MERCCIRIPLPVKFLLTMEMIMIYPVFIGMALAQAQLAHSRGYSSRWWFLIGMVLPIISIPFTFLLKDKGKKQTGYHAPVVNENKDKVLFKRA
jgi:hypothetical protein